MKRLKNYTVKTSDISNGHGYCNSLLVEILKDGIKIGEYTRNYHSMYNTFYPFKWKEKEYALYSHDYETVSLMSLPDCQLIVEHNSGFCPVDFSVPNDYDYWDESKLDPNSKIANLAIVAGCVWGDDSGGWKLEAIDLSKISEGKLKVQDLFGYCELGSNELLDDCVAWMSLYNGRILIPLMSEYQFEENNSESGFLPHSMTDIKHYAGKRWDNYEMRQTFKV